MEWSDALSAGVLQIDSQHKELIARTNSRLPAMQKGRDIQQELRTFETN